MTRPSSCPCIPCPVRTRTSIRQQSIPTVSSGSLDNVALSDELTQRDTSQATRRRSSKRPEDRDRMASRSRQAAKSISPHSLETTWVESNPIVEAFEWSSWILQLLDRAHGASGPTRKASSGPCL